MALLGGGRRGGGRRQGGWDALVGVAAPEDAQGKRGAGGKFWCIDIPMEL